MTFKESIFKKFLKILHKTYSLFRKPHIENDKSISDIELANDIIYDLIKSGKPCMIARYGGFELNILINYLGVRNKEHSIIDYIKGEIQQWWWNPKCVNYLISNAGFFPGNSDSLSRFGKLMLEDSEQLDILGSCWAGEKIINDLLKDVQKIKLVFLEPWHSKNPWSRILRDKRVLIIHPFSNSIKSQYNRRELLFEDNRVLPEFRSLRVIKAVQSIGGKCSDFETWFDALDWMKSEMDKEPYDIAIIGCGAYGFPLAAHAKKTGHQGIHLGGATQLLFGITGNRWIKEYGMGDEYFNLLPKGAYAKLMNEYWIKPSADETPINASNVEGACYW